MSQSCGQPVQVSAQPKQGAPWQFNNLKCHLGAIASPLGTVIVIISGQNTFPVPITCYRLCSSLLGTVSSFFERDVISYWRYLYSQPVSSSYLPTLITVIISIVTLICARKLTALWLFFASSRLWREISLIPKVCLDSLSSLNLRLWLICSTYTRIIKLPWLQTTIYWLMKSQIIVCPPPHDRTT